MLVCRYPPATHSFLWRHEQTQHPEAKRMGEKEITLTVWLDTFGCHTFVSNFIFGGING